MYDIGTIAKVGLCIIAAVFAGLHIVKFISKRIRKYEGKFYSSLIRFPRYVTGFNESIAFPKHILKNIQFKKGLLKVDYEVPSSICVEKVTADKKLRCLALGGVLAIADSLTSLLIMTDDQTHRPGVSVSLAGNMLATGPQGSGYATILAGDVVSIVCKTSKLGANLGFSEATFYHGTQAFAHVTHVKYLKMGAIFDNWIGPLLPLKLTVRSMFNPDKSQRYTGYKDKGSKDYKLLCRLAADVNLLLEDNLNLSPAAVPAPTTPTAAPTVPTYSCTVHRGLENPFGSLHGGAVACIADEAARRARASEAEADRHQSGVPRSSKAQVDIVSMEVNYLAPGKGALAVEVRPIMMAGRFGISSNTAAVEGAMAAGPVGQDTLVRELAGCTAHELEELLPGHVTSECKPKGTASSDICNGAKAATLTDEVYSVILKQATGTGKKSENENKHRKGGDAKVFADCKVVARCTLWQ